MFCTQHLRVLTAKYISNHDVFGAILEKRKPRDVIILGLLACAFGQCDGLAGQLGHLGGAHVQEAEH